MIDFLKGNLVHSEIDYIVIEVNSIGYRVFVANPHVFSAQSNELITIYIHHHVREDVILLFGFQTRDEQTLFRRLLEVSGIGPKVALGVLSGGHPEDVVAAIQQEDIAYLKKLPGIGMKTAQRMVLDLKDKLAHYPLRQANTSMANRSVTSGSGSAMTSVWQEAKQGLIVLGYAESEVDLIWSKIKPKMKESDTVEIMMKLALQAFFTK